MTARLNPHACFRVLVMLDICRLVVFIDDNASLGIDVSVRHERRCSSKCKCIKAPITQDHPGGYSAGTWTLSPAQAWLCRLAHPNARSQARGKRVCRITVVFTLSHVHRTPSRHRAQDWMRIHTLCPFQLHLLPTFVFFHNVLNCCLLTPNKQTKPYHGLKSRQFLVDTLRTEQIVV
jgi:hypothetical protein